MQQTHESGPSSWINQSLGTFLPTYRKCTLGYHVLLLLFENESRAGQHQTRTCCAHHYVFQGQAEPLPGADLVNRLARRK